MRRRADAVLLLAAGVAVGVLTSFGVSKTADEVAEDRVAEDAAVVFCLSPAERGHLTDAAVSLGLARHGPDQQLMMADRALTPPAWRSQHHADFTRACTALIAARRSPRGVGAASGFLTTLNALLSVAFGALLTLLARAWQDMVARGRQEADALRTATQEFVRAAEAFIAAWTATVRSAVPVEGRALVRERRNHLARLLGRIARAHPGWTVPLLRGALSAGPLGEGMTQGWNGTDATVCARRARELEQELQILDADADRIAYALEHPGRPHPALRGPLSEEQS